MGNTSLWVLKYIEIHMYSGYFQIHRKYIVEYIGRVYLPYKAVRVSEKVCQILYKAKAVAAITALTGEAVATTSASAAGDAINCSTRASPRRARSGFGLARVFGMTRR